MTARYLTRARLRELESKLTQWDWAVLRELASLRFVASFQLARLVFADDQRAARRTLLRLTRLDVLERLPRSIGGASGGGSSSFVYHMAPAGQCLSMERGWLPKGRPRRPSIPGQLFVRHALAVAELHAQLSEAERNGRFELLSRDAEPVCWRNSAGAVLKPDSYLRLGIGDFEDSFFIEVDRGTLGSRALRRQLGCYANYYRSGVEQGERGVFPRVLWLAPDARRVEAIAELIALLPSAERELFAVAKFDDALDVMTK